MEKPSDAQAFQWFALFNFFPWLAVTAGLSAILSAFVSQYVLAVINAVVFFGSFLCFLTAGGEWPVLAVFLMIYMAGGFVLNAFYSVALLDDFVTCENDTCAGGRMFLFQANYILICILTAVTFLTAKQCWIILSDARDIAQRAFEDSERTRKGADKRD